MSQKKRNGPNLNELLDAMMRWEKYLHERARTMSLQDFLEYSLTPEELEKARADGLTDEQIRDCILGETLLGKDEK
jgi:hypothetical protein